MGKREDIQSSTVPIIGGVLALCVLSTALLIIEPSYAETVLTSISLKGDSTAFHTTCPLNVARYGSTVGTIPGGWPYQTIWQNADTYAYGGDSDIFNGALSNLQKLATG